MRKDLMDKLGLVYNPVDDMIWAAEVRVTTDDRAVIVGGKSDFTQKAVGAVFEMLKSRLERSGGDVLEVACHEVPGYTLTMSKDPDVPAEPDDVPPPGEETAPADLEPSGDRRSAVPHGNARAVVDLTAGERYPSLGAAASAFQRSRQYVSGCISKRELVDGHALCFADDKTPLDAGSYTEPAVRRGRPVLDIVTGTVYPTQNHAAKALGVASAEVRLAIDYREPIGGHMLRYADAPDADTPA